MISRQIPDNWHAWINVRICGMFQSSRFIMTEFGCFRRLIDDDLHWI